MTEREYNEVASIYETTFGEPLVADADWVTTFFDAAESAVTGSGAFGPDQPDEEHHEIIERTVVTIGVLTHGVAAWEGARS
jgi:hypothetical protein